MHVLPALLWLLRLRSVVHAIDCVRCLFAVMSESSASIAKPCVNGVDSSTAPRGAICVADSHCWPPLSVRRVALLFGTYFIDKFAVVKERMEDPNSFAWTCNGGCRRGAWTSSKRNSLQFATHHKHGAPAFSLQVGGVRVSLIWLLAEACDIRGGPN